MRERLIELLMQGELNADKKGFFNCSQSEQKAEIIANYLLENGVFVPQWISVEDRLPEEKVNCIVHYVHSYCDNDGYWAIGFCFYDGEKFQFESAYKVTHWMPLPEPPKAG